MRRGHGGDRGRGSAHRAQRGQPLPPLLIKEGVTQKIAEHVYAIPDFTVVLVPNVTIIVGTRGTLVVDTGMGARNGPRGRRYCGRRSRWPTSASSANTWWISWCPRAGDGDGGQPHQERHRRVRRSGPRDRATALRKDGKTVDETVRTLQDELQSRFNRAQMARAIRAADNEAQ